jgi:D-beta-D-heptose 7-phosphate kinase/D-beta-D-heptose 1-phosphate adenosyltransferase
MEFKQKNKIAVIGDVMLDEFIFGEVNRINPEAPVPVLEFKDREFRLGGAAGVANNIFSLGGHCVLIGRIGKDKKIKKILENRNIHYDFIEDNSIPTITKTRLMAGSNHLLRLDREKKIPITSKDVKKIIKKVKNVDIIVVSDYAKGVVTKELMDELRKLDKIILADPKVTTPELFKGVYLIKPNLEETKKDLGVDVKKEAEVEKAGKFLQNKYKSNVLITRGKDGMSLFEKGHKPLHIPANVREVYEVAGAGDVVIATIAWALASQKSLDEATVLSNKAAGISVGKVGTCIVTKKELFSKMEKEHEKVKTREEMKEIVKDLKKKGKKVVFTNGCFDILHIGHTRLLNFSKKQGDVLILGLNTDKSIKKIKGPKRPIVNEKERAEIMSELACVDYIVFFDETTPEKIISELKPDVQVKGGDYNPKDYKQMPEAKIVHGYGGKVKIFKIIDGKATTNIIDKIKKR